MGMTPPATMPFQGASTTALSYGGSSYKPEPKKSRQDRRLKKAGKRPAKTFGRTKR